MFPAVVATHVMVTMSGATGQDDTRNPRASRPSRQRCFPRSPRAPGAGTGELACRQSPRASSFELNRQQFRRRHRGRHTTPDHLSPEPDATTQHRTRCAGKPNKPHNPSNYSSRFLRLWLRKSRVRTPLPTPLPFPNSSNNFASSSSRAGASSVRGSARLLCVGYIRDQSVQRCQIEMNARMSPPIQPTAASSVQRPNRVGIFMKWTAPGAVSRLALQGERAGPPLFSSRLKRAA
jgi:hypothetical protein